MDGLHPHDSRKCSSPGCPETAGDEFTTVYTEGRVLRFCSVDCANHHAELFKRHLPELSER